MNDNRNKLYLTLFLCCLLGYGWVFINIFFSSQYSQVQVCWLKKIFHIPCPSCGTTRSILKIIQGEYGQAFYINPLGFVLSSGLLIIPLLLVVDMCFKKNSLFCLYYYVEKWLKKPFILIPLSILVIINWIWNIGKGL